MIECPSCGAHNIENSFFCDECGTELTDGAKRVSSPQDGTVDLKLVFEGEAVERNLRACLSDELLIGRLNADNGVSPDIDLEEWGGVEAGVSRSHAALYYRGAEVYLKDLGSTNGTRINGKRLTPYVEHPLRGGDRLVLGGLSVTVEIAGEDRSAVNSEG
jgi:pSer/pThr/pTyr-binding forkhead associated (FHA) protein